MSPGESSSNGRRLNGWKEIAAYFGKGVRTVQRWEKAFALPVHRIGIGGGEIVFAFVAELERWQQTAEALAAGGRAAASADEDASRTVATVPGGGTHRRAWWTNVAVVGPLIAALLVIVFVLGIPGRFAGRPAPLRPEAGTVRTRNPQHVVVSDGKLRAFAADGTVLWDAPFEVPLGPGTTLDPDPRLPLRARRVVADLDGDGLNEVLFDRVERAANRFLYCFNSDGSQRFVRALGRDVRFGDKTFRAPFYADGIFVTGRPNQPKSVWAIGAHNAEFPSVLVRMDPRGNIVSEYWSNGHITALAEAEIRGRPSIVVGACNNDLKGASLAVFDEADVSGSAPAAHSNYACRDCPPGAPSAFFVFPSSQLAMELGGVIPVRTVDQSGSTLVIGVEHAPVIVPPDPQPLSAVSLYFFDSDLALIDIDVATGYEATQQRLERLGRVTARSRLVPGRTQFPVLSWVGDGFVPVRPRGAASHPPGGLE